LIFNTELEEKRITLRNACLRGETRARARGPPNGMLSVGCKGKGGRLAWEGNRHGYRCESAKTAEESRNPNAVGDVRVRNAPTYHPGGKEKEELT